ncbi:MAG: hypothetical protein AAF726_03260 [Planctomycetota bacterium]
MQFACAADEVWRLQRGSDEDCLLFQRWSNRGKRITDRGTRQGFWVFSPGGEVLGRINSRNPEKVCAMLDGALERWAELDDKARQLDPTAEVAPAHRWEDGYPDGGLALERFSRDIDERSPEGEPSNRWNRDTVWFSAGEVRAMLPQSTAVGDTFALDVLADRLARYVLVDDAHGQTLPYATQELERAELVARVVAIDSAHATVELTGATAAAVTDDEWLYGDDQWRPKRRFPHSIRTTVAGTATLDLVAGTFVDVDLVALGVRTGRTNFNGRGREGNTSLLGFHLSLAPDRLPPTFVSLYGVDWIPKPEVPTWRDSPEEAGVGGR